MFVRVSVALLAFVTLAIAGAAAERGPNTDRIEALFRVSKGPARKE